jgi:hypothetical protein
LFNLRHASARNVIERIFGILKRRFRILQLPPEYHISIQALIPPALAALHNFIRKYDPKEINMYLGDEPLDDESLNNQPLDLDMGLHPEDVGELATGPVTHAESARANERRDKMAAEMWEQYQNYLESRVARNQ